jgi:hypothetical protein
VKELDALIKEVAAIEKGLANPTRFYAARQDAYHSTAFSIARRTILALRPPAADPEEWARRAETVASRILSELMLGGGLAISIADSANDATPAEPGGNPSNPTLDDLIQWIRAGLRGEPGGKRITPEDRARIAKYGERAVATVVKRAIYSDRGKPAYQRLRRAVHRYLSGADEAASDDILDAVLTAWEEHFTIRHERDLKRYVAAVAGKI